MATTSTETRTDTLSRCASYPHIPSTGTLAGRMRYADPKDLPSYPSLGLKKDDAAASAAASLGWANTRPVAPWTPDSSKNAPAQRAASLANDTTSNMAAATTNPSRPPNAASAPGSKTAAVLAAESANERRTAKRKSMPASGWGNSAANQAFASAGGTGNPREPMPTLERQKSLRAAKGAMASNSGRPRSISSPLTYPDSANAATNALSAATIAHRPSVKKQKTTDDPGASPITNMNRQMYTSRPPVKPDVDEKNREAVLHASALAMAKKMYTQQQKVIDAAKQAGVHHADSRPESSGANGLQQPMPFTNLQEAAYKLAQERLARLHEEHQKNRDFADYYGTATTASPPTSGRRLTKMGSKLRRRASSEGDASAVFRLNDDRDRSRQIRKQMSLFSTRIGEVDQAKRARDREALLAAAQRNVKARMEDMDEIMYQEQGKIAPSKLSEWELKARAAAQARYVPRMEDRTDKVDLGAGVYMDREKIQEIAAKRVQPVLDEINEKAQTEHLRIAALKAEQEKKRLEAEAEKARNAEIKETARHLKEEEKARCKQLKEEAKTREKDEKRLIKQEHALDGHRDDANEQDLLEGKSGEGMTPSSHKRRLSRPFTPKLQTKGTSSTMDGSRRNGAYPISPVTSPESANESAGARVKNWLRSRLHKPRAKSVSVIKSGNDSSTKIADKSSHGHGSGGGFIGGHALTRFRHADGTGSMTSLSEGTRSASMREVALAGYSFSPPLRPTLQQGEARSHQRRSYGRMLSNTDSFVSSNESSSTPGEEVDEGSGDKRESRPRTQTPLPLTFGTTEQGSNTNPNSYMMMAPPRALVDPAKVTPRSSGSPNRDSKFIEMME